MDARCQGISREPNRRACRSRRKLRTMRPTRAKTALAHCGTRRHAICAVCRRGFWRNESWKALCVACWRQRKERESAGARQSIAVPDVQADLVPDDEMLRRLLQLCHPDRHNGSEAARQRPSRRAGCFRCASGCAREGGAGSGPSRTMLLRGRKDSRCWSSYMCQNLSSRTTSWASVSVH